VLFLAFKEWVGKNVSLQISREKNLNVAWGFYLGRWDIRKSNPAWKRVLWYKVSELVDSCCAFGIKACFFFFTLSPLIVSSFNGCFYYIIVARRAGDFSEKSCRWWVEFGCKLFQRFLEAVGFLFAKADASPWKNSLLGIEVLNETNSSDFGYLATLFFWLWPSKSNLHYLRVLLKICCELSVVVIIVDF